MTTTTSTRADTRSRRHHWLALGTIALGVSLIIMDATIVNVALPVVIEDLHLDASDAQWMNAIYSLVFAALLLTVGRVGDLHGRRLVFAAGMTLFMASSIVAGAATSPTMLIGARFAQGIGAAMILPTTLSTLNTMFLGRERAIAFAVYGSTIGGMAAMGPLVGGWLATDVSWRWAFWLNIPFGLLTLAGIARFVPETRDTQLRPGLDLTGALLSALGMAGLVFGLIEGAYFGWWRQDSGALSPVPVAFAVGAIALVAFVFVERSRNVRDQVVLIDLRLTHLRSLRYGSIAALIVAFGELGLLFTLPLLLQGAMGYSALGTGWLIVALAAGTFLISAATPQLTARLGERTVVRIGLFLEAFAVGTLALTLRIDMSAWEIAGWLFLYGLGVGMATAQLTSVIMSEVPKPLSGQASGLQSSVRQLGSALGIAVLGGLLISSLSVGTSDRLAEAGTLPTAAQEQVVSIVHDSAGAAIPSLAANPATVSAAGSAADAMIAASRITTGAASLILLIGLAATALLRPPDEESPVEP